MQLTPELRALQEEIEEYAHGYGLDFFQIIYEVLDWEDMNQVASYCGFPTRYPHWTFGMEYERMSKSYAYGLSKIYEMVINNDPCYAYLLKSNKVVDQKLVMAHVCAHCDFFKNNIWFSKTDRKMMDEMANHAVRIRRYIEKHGFERVEQFLDTCQSLERLIDPHALFIKREAKTEFDSDVEAGRIEIPKLKSADYMDKFINPKEFIEEQKQRILQEHKRKKNFPDTAQKDVLKFFIDYAPLTDWEKDILSSLREEAYYFAPQAQTKIMNEGWATYWHSKIMTSNALKDSEVIDYADHHSGTVAMGGASINPYKIGLELFRDIEERWDKGRFGKEYDECTNLAEKKAWDKKLNQGRQKIFDVRRTHNDITFIDTFFTPEFCEKHKLFTFGYNQKNATYEIKSREFKQIKDKLLFLLTNAGRPHIYVADGNFENRGELLLFHYHEGVDLQVDEADLTLEKGYNIWKRPVNLKTKVDGKGKLLIYDGKEHTERAITYSEEPIAV